MIPQYTDIKSRKHCDVSSFFSKNVPLKVPLVSSPMDTVTEYQMAIDMARNGGIGVIHRFMSIKEQVSMIKRVKRAENFIIRRPYIIDENESIEHLNLIRRDLGVKSFLVTKLDKKNVSFNEDDYHFSNDYDIYHTAFSK